MGNAGGIDEKPSLIYRTIFEKEDFLRVDFDEPPRLLRASGLN